MLASLTAEPQPGSVITIPGATTVETYEAMVQWLQTHYGDDAVEAHQHGPARARFTVQHAGSLADLVKSLDHQTVDGVTMQVDQVVGNEITVSLIEAGVGGTPQ